MEGKHEAKIVHDTSIFKVMNKEKKVADFLDTS